jgi:hypothetical protein
MSIESTSVIPSISALVNLGFTLVPIPPRKKRPMHKSWNHRGKVIDSPDQVNQLSDLNIGLAHAFCTPKPTCAIDFDDVIRAVEWLSERGVDLIALQNAPDAVGIASGKANSFKLIYCLPDGVPALASKAITGPSGNMMLEFRCATKKGLTVQDVLPPSVHPSGSKYRWVGAGSILSLPNLPDCLLQIWLELLKSTLCKERLNAVPIVTPETPRQEATARSDVTASTDIR